MNNDNVLKKEFSKKDVQRARNLLTGKTNIRTSQGIGYTKKYNHYKEGDVWEEDGKKWTVKNGIKQNITKMDKFKKLNHMPLFCPECDTLMKKRLDKKVFPAYQKCFDCVINDEAELKWKGQSEEYYKNLQNSHIQTTIDEYAAFIKDKISQSNTNFVTEAGDVEDWKGGISKEQLEQELQEGLEFLEGLKVK